MHLYNKSEKYCSIEWSVMCDICFKIPQVHSFASEMEGLSKTVESEIQEQKRWDSGFILMMESPQWENNWSILDWLSRLVETI